MNHRDLAPDPGRGADGFEHNGVHGLGALTGATDQQGVDPARSEARWRSDKRPSQRGSHHGDLVGAKIGCGAFERNENPIDQRPQDTVGYSRDSHSVPRRLAGLSTTRPRRLPAGSCSRRYQRRAPLWMRATSEGHCHTAPGINSSALIEDHTPRPTHALHSQGFHPPRLAGHHRPLESPTRAHQRHGRIGGLTAKFFGQRERRVKVSSRATCCNYHVHPIPKEARGRPVGPAREILKRMPIATRLTINEEPP